MTQIRKISMTGLTALILLMSSVSFADALLGTAISATDDKTGNFFGGSVSISGDYAIAGAHGNNAAYVFVRNGTAWSQQGLQLC
ncbi:FG-GAP repeat protein [Desulfococcaceae bacterium HSG8]|nr:FG-GAP repeat protein [Desulfococcaceae bacterium HSG8]